MAGGMIYIRNAYGVPAKRGMKVLYKDMAPDPCPGVIRSAKGGKLLIQLEGRPNPTAFHPQDPNLTYLPKEAGDAQCKKAGGSS